MRRRSIHSRAGDVGKQILSVLNDRFQSAGIISAQVIIPPDAICRRQMDCEHRRSFETAKNNIVMRTLLNLFMDGKVERRAGKAGLLEYRLGTGKKQRGKILEAIEKAFVNGENPYDVHHNRNTVAAYLCRLRKKYSIAVAKQNTGE